MTLIEQVASRMGMSLLQLSGYLNISKSHLHMSKQGQRSLPARHFTALLVIQEELNSIEMPASIALQPEEARQLRKRLHKLQHQYFATQRKLQQLEERYAKLYLQQQWIALQLQRGTHLTTRQQLWLELQQATLQRRLKRQGAAAIVRCKAYMEASGSEVLLLEAALI